MTKQWFLIQKQWFLIQSLGATVDLSLVSHVFWNHKSQQKIYTEICLGTTPADGGDNSSNTWWIRNRSDRKALQSALIALGLPTVELEFAEHIDDYVGEAVLERYKDPEEFNVDR